MMTSSECLAKADQMNIFALRSAAGAGRDAYAGLARGWPRTATLARDQDRLLAAVGRPAGLPWEFGEA